MSREMGWFDDIRQLIVKYKSSQNVLSNIDPPTLDELHGNQDLTNKTSSLISTEELNKVNEQLREHDSS